MVDDRVDENDEMADVEEDDGFDDDISGEDMLMLMADDIEKINEDWEDEPWQKFSDRYPEHTAGEWQQIWLTKLRPVYLQQRQQGSADPPEVQPQDVQSPASSGSSRSTSEDELAEDVPSSTSRKRKKAAGTTQTPHKKRKAVSPETEHPQQMVSLISSDDEINEDSVSRTTVAARNTSEQQPQNASPEASRPAATKWSKAASSLISSFEARIVAEEPGSQNTGQQSDTRSRNTNLPNDDDPSTFDSATTNIAVAVTRSATKLATAEQSLATSDLNEGAQAQLREEMSAANPHSNRW